VTDRFELPWRPVPREAQCELVKERLSAPLTTVWYGTGKLKAALREYLKYSPYVENFRPGNRAEGGDGVTVAKVE